MPRAKKSRQPQPPIVDEYPDLGDLNLDIQEDEEASLEYTRPSRRKSRNASANTSAFRVESSSPEPLIEDSITPAEPSLPPVRQSLLGQISFPTHTKSRPVNIRDEVVSSEKVSDQYTPPSDAGIPDDVYGKSPNADSEAVSSVANTPPVEPDFSARTSFKARSPPISPPQRYARPLSFGSSVPPMPPYARHSPASYGSPQAPHLPQPHFYGAHDIDLGIPKLKQSAEEGPPLFSKFVQFSTLPSPQRNAVILGYEGRLRFCLYDGVAIEDIGALPSLPGTVIDAELLRWASGSDPFSPLRPLIAINTLQTGVNHEGVAHHRFVVSVYSLSQQKHISDLLQVSADPVQQTNIPGFVHPSTKLSSHLRIASAGNYLTVASGRSGEVFIFCPTASANGPAFECLSKLWTAVQPQEQKRDSSHVRVASVEAIRSGTKQIKTDDDVPILAMSGRWLAICPPPISSQHTIGAELASEVLVCRHAGLEASNVGSRPSINCDVDSPDADTLLGKVARGVAQEMVKGAKWLGDQGLQAWQSYWKREDVNNLTIARPLYSNGNYYNSPAHGQFPPTHADARSMAKDPEIISIFDLKSFQDLTTRRSGPPAPLATFLPPHGCSFLSFAPNGLILLSASHKGDYQYVWDLLEMRHNRVSSIELESDAPRATPRVRQIARFDRMSGSTIIDVVWEKPTLARFALLTKNKTIHLFDLPAATTRWPPNRKPKKARPTSAPPTGPPTVEHGPAPLGGFFASAMSIAGRTQPMLANLRGRAPSSSGGLAGIGSAGIGIATATGARGSKAVASGLSKSLGAATETVSRLHHAGESRLHLKSEKEALPSRMIWMNRTSKPGLCIIGDSGIKFYHVRRSKALDQRQIETTVFDARRAVIVKFPGSISEARDANEDQGYWTYKQIHSSNPSTVHPLSFAEIETNAPYQPFHLDRRISMSVMDQNLQDTQIVVRTRGKISGSENGWVFGDEIPMIKVNKNPAQCSYDEDETGSVMYREMAMDGEQVVSTTRRRKKAGGLQYGSHTADEEGFFEDDFEVLDFASDRV